MKLPMGGRDGLVPKEKIMPNDHGTRGGSHEQHVKAGQQSHKNDTHSASSRTDSNSDSHSTRGGTHEQHVKAGQQSHKND
jgi:hypothetical protein